MRLMELMNKNEESVDGLVSVITISNVVLDPYYSLLLDSNMKKSNKRIDGKMYQLEDLPLLKSRKVDILVVNLSLRVLLGDSFFSALSDEENATEIETVLNVLSEIMYQVKSKISFSYGIFFSFASVYEELSMLFGAAYSCQQIVNKINMQVYQKYKDEFIFIASDTLVARVGMANIIDRKNFYRWNGLYDREYIDVMTKEVVHIYNIESGKRPKLIIVDCDNVLWSGIVADIGKENIVLGFEGEGKKYRDFQMMLKAISSKGVMLAIASKNDYEDIEYILQENKNMLLRKKDFIWIAANWNPKSANIVARVREMNIAFDSVWFIDDSLNEVLEINEVIPEINTIVFDVNNYRNNFREINLKANIDKDEMQNRVNTYVMDEKRRELKNSVIDYSTYLQKLQTQISIKRYSEDEKGRISELSFRTNKFTNGRRLTQQDIERYNMLGSVYVVYVEDVFGSLGLVASFIVVRNELILFCLSCRAANRGVEEKVIEYIKENYLIESYQFETTGKNEQIRLLLDELIAR